MVTIVIAFPNIVSYGDPAERARIEQAGEGGGVDLGSLMQESDSGKQDEPGADFLKNLQGGEAK